MNEIFDTMNDFAVRLKDLGVEYMVTGSVAMASYVTARATMDIDVVIEIDQVDIQKFERRFAGDYYIALESVRRARDHHSMFNVVFHSTGMKVDFIARKPDRYEIAKFDRRQLLRIDDTEFWVISKEDLILSKLAWAKDSHSERQFEDVRSLMESGADTTMISTEISDQNLLEVWEAYTEWKTRIEK